MAITYENKESALNEIKEYCTYCSRKEDRDSGIDEIISFVSIWDIDKNIDIESVRSWKHSKELPLINDVLSFLNTWASESEVELILETFDTCTNHVILPNLEKKLKKNI